jgi:hypothetical protein
MPKITLNNLSNLLFPSTSTINANNDAIEFAFENTLSRNGTSPNEMNADLDMNGFSILNVGAINEGVGGGVYYNVLNFGAVGDGTTDDSSAIQAACTAAEQAGGGIVFMPATGAAYVASNIILSNSVILMGIGTRTFWGETASVADWTSTGTWIKSTDTTNPTVTLNGHGSGLIGVNFIRDQVTPGVGVYTPTTFPYEVKIFATCFLLQNIATHGTTHDVWIAYTDSNGGGTWSTMRDLFLGALQVGIKFDNVNDILDMQNIHMRSLFYQSTESMADYVLANRIGWDVGYLDNVQVNNVQFFHCDTGMLFTDQTCLGNTHSMFNGQLNNIQFNLVRHAMDVAAGDTAVTGIMNNVLAQSGPGFGSTFSDDLFRLTSDNIDLAFNGLRIPDAGGRAVVLGSGSGGKLTMDNVRILDYSTQVGGSAGIDLATGATLYLGTAFIEASGTPGSPYQGGTIVTWLP